MCALRRLPLDGLLERLIVNHVVPPLRHPRLGRLPQNLAELHASCPGRRTQTHAFKVRPITPAGSAVDRAGYTTWVPPDIDESTKVFLPMRFLIGPSVEELSEYSGGMQRGRHKRQPASEGGGRAPRGHNRWWRGCVWRAVECVSSVLGVGAVCARHRPNSHPAAASRSRSARCLRPALSLSFSSSRAPTVLGSQAQSFSFFCSRLHSSPCAAFCCSSFPAA